MFGFYLPENATYSTAKNKVFSSLVTYLGHLKLPSLPCESQINQCQKNNYVIYVCVNQIVH